MKSMEKSFGHLEYEGKKQKTGREQLLKRMDVLIPRGDRVEEIRPYYPQAGKGGVTYPLESMLRVHCVQLFYKLNDPAMEDMLHGAQSVRRFTGIPSGKHRETPFWLSPGFSKALL